MRGLNSKLKNLYLNSFSFNSSVIVFTETWLNPSIYNTEIFFSTYSIFRRDRDGKGGGVLIAVKTDLFAEVISLPSSIAAYNIEFISVRIIFQCKTYFITCSYIPPQSDVNIYTYHVEAISYTYYKFII